MQKRVEFMRAQLDKCVPRKAPEELAALLVQGSEAQRREAAAALTDTPAALSVLIHAAKHDDSEKVRDLALHSLIDTLIGRERLVTESTVGTIADALLKDTSESVRSTAEAGIMVLATDYPKKALPILRAAERREKGPGAERLASTLGIISSLSSIREMAQKRENPRQRNVPEAIKLPGRAEKQPQKLRIAA